jgi:hypothetical protein
MTKPLSFGFHHSDLPSMTSIGCAPGSKSSSSNAFTCTLKAPAIGRLAC